MREEVIVLEHHAHLEHQRAQLSVLLVDGPAVRAGGNERLAADADFAAVHGFQVGEVREQGRILHAVGKVGPTLVARRPEELGIEKKANYEFPSDDELDSIMEE